MKLALSRTCEARTSYADYGGRISESVPPVTGDSWPRDALSVASVMETGVRSGAGIGHLARDALGVWI